jgi:hypothetical protein
LQAGGNADLRSIARLGEALLDKEISGHRQVEPPLALRKSGRTVSDRNDNAARAALYAGYRFAAEFISYGVWLYFASR